MNQQGIELAKRAAQISLPWAGGLTAALIVFGLIPCCGLLLFPLGAFLIAFQLTPKLYNFPPGETKTIQALYAGLGFGAMAAAALVIAAIIGGTLNLILSSTVTALFGSFKSVPGATVSGALGIIFGTIGAIFAGLIFGILFSWLGSYFALDRMPATPQTDYSRPF